MFKTSASSTILQYSSSEFLGLPVSWYRWCSKWVCPRGMCCLILQLTVDCLQCFYDIMNSHGKGWPHVLQELDCWVCLLGIGDLLERCERITKFGWVLVQGRRMKFDLLVKALQELGRFRSDIGCAECTVLDTRRSGSRHLNSQWRGSRSGGELYLETLSRSIGNYSWG